MSQFNDDPNYRVINQDAGNMKKKLGRRIGFSTCFGCVVTLAIIGGIGIGILAIFSAMFNPSLMNNFMAVFTGIQAPQSQTLVTDPDHFDPIIGLTQAQDFAGVAARLVSIDASYVRADGTMDLNASYSPAPRTTYKFMVPVARPTDAPPVGVSGSTNGQWYAPITIQAYKPGSRSHVSTMGGGVSAEYDYVNDGMLREIDDPTSSFSGTFVPAPECTMQELWAQALKKDAPKEAVAIIDYDSEGYTFNISGVLYLRFTSDCKLEE